jgi:putative membrane protein
MKKLAYLFIIGTLTAGTACTSTDATTDDTTTETRVESAVDNVEDAAAGVVDAVTTPDMKNLDDPNFLMTAASSNMLEIELGRMAVQNASNQRVKDFGQMMVDHHSKAHQELKTVASKTGTTLPQTMMPMHQKMVDKLSGKTGTSFDEDYMDTMETAHAMDIAMFEAKTSNASNPIVKEFATKMLPNLQSHREKASNIESGVD